jgi:nitrite reductase/ring-hydroxylating ferredoxin subunit
MADWQPLGALDMLPDGSMRELDVAGHAVLLLRVRGQCHAYQGRCPHQRGHLARGTLKDEVITCPVHGSKFSAVTGACIAWVDGLAGWMQPMVKLLRPPMDLAAYPVREDQGQVWVDMESLQQ